MATTVPKRKSKLIRTAAIAGVGIGVTGALVLAARQHMQGRHQHVNPREEVHKLLGNDPLIHVFGTEVDWDDFLQSTIECQEGSIHAHLKVAARVSPSIDYPVSIGVIDTGDVVQASSYSSFLSEQTRPLIRVKKSGVLAAEHYWVPFLLSPGDEGLPRSPEFDYLQHKESELEEINLGFVKSLARLAECKAKTTACDRGILRVLCVLLARFVAGAALPASERMNIYAVCISLFQLLSSNGRDLLHNMPAYLWAPVLLMTNTLPSTTTRREERSAVVGVRHPKMVKSIWKRMEAMARAKGVVSAVNSSPSGLCDLLSLKFFFLVLDGRSNCWENGETSTAAIEGDNDDFFRIDGISPA